VPDRCFVLVLAESVRVVIGEKQRKSRKKQRQHKTALPQPAELFQALDMTAPKTQMCLLEIKDHILYVTLNRPNNANAMSPPFSEELSTVWDYYEANPSLLVAIVTGKGKFFCAGFDLAWFSKNFDPKVLNVSKGFAGLTGRTTLNKPIIAAINGPALGGGWELALHCDIIIASPSAAFGFPEPKVGLAAFAGGVAFLPNLIGYHRAMEILLTGRNVSAAEAYQLGLVSQVVEGDLIARATEIANQIITCSPDSIRATKVMAKLALARPDFTQNLELQYSLPEVKSIFASPNITEGVQAFAQKRKPNWKYAKL